MEFLYSRGVVGIAGAAILILMVIVRRKMKGLNPIRLDAKTIKTAAVALVGVVVFGLGMCMTMIWNMMIPGIIVGIVGIIILLTLIPLVKGLK